MSRSGSSIFGVLLLVLVAVLAWKAGFFNTLSNFFKAPGGSGAAADPTAKSSSVLNSVLQAIKGNLGGSGSSGGKGGAPPAPEANGKAGTPTSGGKAGSKTPTSAGPAEGIGANVVDFGGQAGLNLAGISAGLKAGAAQADEILSAIGDPVAAGAAEGIGTGALNFSFSGLALPPAPVFNPGPTPDSGGDSGGGDGTPFLPPDQSFDPGFVDGGGGDGGGDGGGNAFF